MRHRWLHRAEVCELAGILAEAAVLTAWAAVDWAAASYRLVRTARTTTEGN